MDQIYKNLEVDPENSGFSSVACKAANQIVRLGGLETVFLSGSYLNKLIAFEIARIIQEKVIKRIAEKLVNEICG